MLVLLIVVVTLPYASITFVENRLCGSEFEFTVPTGLFVKKYEKGLQYMGSEIVENMKSVKSTAYNRLLERHGEDCANEQIIAINTIIELAETHLLPNSRYFVSDKNENADQFRPGNAEKTFSWDDGSLKRFLDIS